ncbi:MAG TPA: effector-associated domain EAD1-containing protein [Ktedonobacteraceae bacterium]|jgi:hypothetical protein
MQNMSESKIIKVLAYLYDNPDQAKMIARAIGLELSRIAFSHSMEICWSNIWRETELQHKEHDLINSALDDFPKNTKLAQIRDQLIQPRSDQMAGSPNEPEPDNRQKPSPFQAREEFDRCQKKVEELKSIHNILHEIELRLSLLSATMKSIIKDKKQKEMHPLKRFFIKSGIMKVPLDLSDIEMLWEQIVRELLKLQHLASTSIGILEDERFYADSNIVRGPLWVTDLFVLQQPFESSVDCSDINTMEKLSTELLRRCLTHLYFIDKRLLETINELRRVSEPFLRGI